MRTFLCLWVVLLFVSMPIFAQSDCKPKTIIAASYNIRYENDKDGINAWANRKDWIKDLVRFHEWDIFGTQEGLKNQILGLAEMQEYAYVGVGRDDGKDAGEHAAIFYRKDRFTLLEKGNFWLSETPDKPSLGWDAPSNIRICSWAKLKDKNTGKNFFFFSVHYDHRGQIARVESSKLMLKKINEIAGKTPVVLVGDFNSFPDAEAISILYSGLNDAYRVTKQPPYGPVGTANGFNWERELTDRIDYIFCSDKVDVLKYGSLTDFKEKRYPSDHLPIMAKIQIP